MTAQIPLVRDLTYMTSVLALSIIFAPFLVVPYGMLVGLLVSRNTGVGAGLASIFAVSYVWTTFAMISIQGWGGGNFDLYFYWLRGIFLPSPLIAGTLGSVLLAVWRRRTGHGDSLRRSLLIVIGGIVAFGGGALLCTGIAANVLAEHSSSSRNALDAALSVAFYGPLLVGFCMVLIVLRRARRNRLPSHAVQ